MALLAIELVAFGASLNLFITDRPPTRVGKIHVRRA